jgi:hypothetical protein
MASGIELAWTEYRLWCGTWEPVVLMLKESSKWKNHKDLSADAEHRGGATCSSSEGSVMDVERRGCIVQLGLIKQPVMEGFNEFGKVV